MKRAIATLLAAALAVAIGMLAPLAKAQVPIYTKGPSSSTSSVLPGAFPLLAPDGTAALPSYGFSGGGGGMYRATFPTFAGASGFPVMRYTDGQVELVANAYLGWYSSGNAFTGSLDLTIFRDAANTLAQKNGANAQIRRLYATTTGPVYWQETARTAGAVYTAVGGAAQVSYAQTTVPTVTANGGTSPSCVGTDTAMVCTIGTAPPAAATFTVTFNGTWPAAPSCVAMRGTTGASPLVQGVATGTTTVVVNLSANLVASEKYNIICLGVS